MTDKMHMIKAALFESRRNRTRHLAGPFQAGSKRRAPVTGKIVGYGRAILREYALNARPDTGAGPETVQEDERGSFASPGFNGMKLRIRRWLQIESSFFRPAVYCFLSSRRLAADTTASSEAATILVLMPTPNSLPSGCSISM